MKIRLSSGGDDKNKPASKTPTPAEIEAATIFARDMARRRGLMSGENTHTGGQVPPFIDAATGKQLLPGAIDPAVGRLSNKVPLYVKSLEWDSKAGLPFYIDEKTGDMQYVAKDLFHSPRFSPNKGKSLLDIAKR